MMRDDDPETQICAPNLMNQHTQWALGSFEEVSNWKIHIYIVHNH
jgi:hypothetical protein